MWFSYSRKIKYFTSIYKSLNIKRLNNYLKLLFSFCLTKISGVVWHWGLPFSLSVESSTLCNLKCPECLLGANVLSRPGSNMNLELYKKILSESQPPLFWLNLYFQGEPFLNPNLFEMIKEAKNENIFTVVSTNGHFLTDINCQKTIDSELSELIVSIDGISDFSYSKYRKGGDLQIVKEGIIRLIEKKSAVGAIFPFVTVQFLVFKHNENEIPDIINWCKQTKVDCLKLKSAQFNDFGNGEVEPPSIKKYSRYIKDKNNKLILKKRIRNHCFRQWSSAVFSYNGEMVPCCYDKNLQYSFGNISVQTLPQLWKSDKINSFRNIIKKNKKQIEMCCNCW
ncbi:MAG: SPASM domain-containing protein [Marinilabiliaceae bacterium]|nr:SPASM domain-containing protein [Marinilabiliaceae bacterium]